MARRSIFGVWAALLPKQEKSPQPMSSMKIKIILGLVLPEQGMDVKTARESRIEKVFIAMKVKLIGNGAFDKLS